MLFQYLVIFAVPAVLVLIFWGWRQLWWLFPVWGGVWLFFFLISLWEDRWRMVTPKDKAWGAPSNCPQCDHELDIARRGQQFTVRCPICGFTRRHEPRGV
jgi:Zn ribbon nucleic-acid-binding protein